MRHVYIFHSSRVLNEHRKRELGCHSHLTTFVRSKGKLIVLWDVSKTYKVLHDTRCRELSSWFRPSEQQLYNLTCVTAAVLRVGIIRRSHLSTHKPVHQKRHAQLAKRTFGQPKSTLPLASITLIDVVHLSVIFHARLERGRDPAPAVWDRQQARRKSLLTLSKRDADPLGACWCQTKFYGCVDFVFVGGWLR